MVLLIDIGNTRIKAATLTASTLSKQLAAVYAKWNRDEIKSYLSGIEGRPQRVVVSNVGGERIANLIAAAAQELWTIAPEFLRSSAYALGVRNAYATPEQLGVDRWLGLLAAFNFTRGSVCVVGIGTAMTIDGVDLDGNHLGGVIVPGPTLATQSLLQNTSDLAERSRSGLVSTELFAANTLGAIEQGVTHMLAALIEKSMGIMTVRLGETPALVLTGGGSSQIAPLLSSKHITVPDLVLQGLAAIVNDHSRST